MSSLRQVTDLTVFELSCYSVLHATIATTNGWHLARCLNHMNQPEVNEHQDWRQGTDSAVTERNGNAVQGLCSTEEHYVKSPWDARDWVSCSKVMHTLPQVTLPQVDESQLVSRVNELFIKVWVRREALQTDIYQNIIGKQMNYTVHVHPEVRKTILRSK
jgi:hypothetical protein